MSNMNDKIKWDIVLLLIICSILISTFAFNFIVKNFEIESYKMVTLYFKYIFSVYGIFMAVYPIAFIVYFISKEYKLTKKIQK